jgi:protein-tyrosine-phosphatase
MSVGAVELCWGLARRLGDGGARRFTRAVARHTMNQVRRNPAVLTQALRDARKLLIVCHGNIIRSPFAARLLQQKLGAAGRISISSAGLEAVPGRPPDETALHLASTRGVDLTSHTARRLALETVTESDVIFVMDVPQLVLLRRRFPEAGDRTFLLTCLAPRTPLEVRDPVFGDEAKFETCFNHISLATGPIVTILRIPNQ